jgi:hypothetical protein
MDTVLTHSSPSKENNTTARAWRGRSGFGVGRVVLGQSGRVERRDHGWVAEGGGEGVLGVCCNGTNRGGAAPEWSRPLL